jgi:hypothetical protein
VDSEAAYIFSHCHLFLLDLLRIIVAGILCDVVIYLKEIVFHEDYEIFSEIVVRLQGHFTKVEKHCSHVKF